jgi:hypothetical protein
MILGIEIALLVVGVLALVRGKLPLDKSHAVYGLPARFLGLIALTPLPASFVVVAIYTVLNVPSGDPAAVNQFVADNRLALVGIEAAIAIGVAVIVFGLGRLFAQEARAPTVKPVRWEDRVRPKDDVDDAVQRWMNARTKKPVGDEAVPLVSADRHGD